MAKITKAIKGGLEYSLWAENEFSPETIWTTWQILVKTSTWYAWVNLSDLGIVIKEASSPINTNKIWTWTEEQYQSLSDYDDETIYYTV